MELYWGADRAMWGVEPLTWGVVIITTTPDAPATVNAAAIAAKSKASLVWVVIKGKRKLTTYAEAAEIAAQYAREEAEREAELMTRRSIERVREKTYEEKRRTKLKGAAASILSDTIKRVKDNREW